MTFARLYRTVSRRWPIESEGLIIKVVDYFHKYGKYHISRTGSQGSLDFWDWVYNQRTPKKVIDRGKTMNNRYGSGVRFGEDGRVRSQDSHASREVEKFDGLSRGQSLSVRKACDKFFESRGLKLVPFGTFVSSKTRNSD
jgi:hypothetical protein